MSAQRFDVRVAVGAADGPRSSQWHFWSRKSDVYAAVSQMGGIQKFSFHSPNICRYAFTKEHGTPSTMQNRAMHEWHRDEAPPMGANRCVRVLRIGFATDLLSTALKPSRSNPTWIAPAAAGGSTVIDIAFTRDTEASVIAALAGDALHVAHRMIAYRRLSNSEAFCITSWHADQGDKVLRMPASAKHKDDLVVFPEDLTQSGRPVRLSLFSNPKDGDFMRVWEMGAFWHPPLSDTEWESISHPYRRERSAQETHTAKSESQTL